MDSASIFPDFSFRRSITADELRHISEPVPIFEHEWRDDDGEKCFAYTVAGWLNGQNIATIQGGCTIGGEVAVVHADSREEADAIACFALADTIRALEGEEAMYQEAHAAHARLGSVSPIKRLDLATASAADTSDEFVEDVRKIRVLRGDDILLTAS